MKKFSLWAALFLVSSMIQMQSVRAEDPPAKKPSSVEDRIKKAKEKEKKDQQGSSSADANNSNSSSSSSESGQSTQKISFLGGGDQQGLSVGAGALFRSWDGGDQLTGTIRAGQSGFTLALDGYKTLIPLVKKVNKDGDVVLEANLTGEASSFLRFGPESTKALQINPVAVGAFRPGGETELYLKVSPLGVGAFDGEGVTMPGLVSIGAKTGFGTRALGSPAGKITIDGELTNGFDLLGKVNTSGTKLEIAYTNDFLGTGEQWTVKGIHRSMVFNLDNEKSKTESFTGLGLELPAQGVMKALGL